ncbi:MAG: hypothetical protein ACWGMZ_06235, partial [Thermoguttaceae bacterium]
MLCLKGLISANVRGAKICQLEVGEAAGRGQIIEVFIVLQHIVSQRVIELYIFIERLLMAKCPGTGLPLGALQFIQYAGFNKGFGISSLECLALLTLR